MHARQQRRPSPRIILGPGPADGEGRRFPRLRAGPRPGQCLREQPHSCPGPRHGRSLGWRRPRTSLHLAKARVQATASLRTPVTRPAPAVEPKEPQRCTDHQACLPPQPPPRYRCRARPVLLTRGPPPGNGRAPAGNGAAISAETDPVPRRRSRPDRPEPERRRGAPDLRRGTRSPRRAGADRRPPRGRQDLSCHRRTGQRHPRHPGRRFRGPHD